jgi:UDP-N-acetylmuramoyl-L-alanyl-D-glutamate--2,6-diaminopimelate ligase
VVNTLFVAIKGTRVDGHDFISDAVKKGAVAIICECLPQKFEDNIIYVKVENTSLVLGFICSTFFDNPSSRLKLIGITGTNGKTTIATLLYKMFMDLGYKVGLLSTICNRINEKTIPSTHTTPDQFVLNELLCTMVKNGCE